MMQNKQLKIRYTVNIYVRDCIFRNVLKSNSYFCNTFNELKIIIYCKYKYTYMTDVINVW